MRIKLPSPSNLTKHAPRPFPREVNLYINTLAAQFSPHLQHHPRASSFFSTTPANAAQQNRIHPSIRRPSDFHTLLQSSSATNTLLLALFRTSTCTSCSTITLLLESVIQSRAAPSPGDTFDGIAFAELDLDSPERDDGGGIGWNTMYDVGIEYAVRSVPTLIGFGGRRAERITDRVADERKLKDRRWVEEWVDEVMRRGDPHPGSSDGRGFLGRLFGGGG